MRSIELKLAGLGAYGVAFGPSQTPHLTVDEAGRGQVMLAAGFRHPLELMKMVSLSGMAWIYKSEEGAEITCIAPIPLPDAEQQLAGDLLQGEVTRNGEFYSPSQQVVSWAVKFSYNKDTGGLLFEVTVSKAEGDPIKLVGLRLSAAVTDPEV